MADKKVENKVADTVDINARMKELVPFRAFKDNGKYKEDIVVGLNGKVYVIQRGVEVMIPRCVKEIIENSIDQDEYASNLMDAESSKFAEQAKNI